MHGADQACERVDEHIIRPSRGWGYLPKSFASIDRKTGKPKTANIVLAIAAGLVIIGLQVLPFSPAALKPASWVIVVVWMTHRRRRPQAAGNRGRGICVGVRTG